MPNPPLILDGLLSDEKLSELLALGAEYAELEFKTNIDLTATEGKIFSQLNGVEKLPKVRWDPLIST